MENISQVYSERTTIFRDNNSTIKNSRNLVIYVRSTYIDVHFHFLHDLTKEGNMELVHCGTQDQIVDLMTKSLTLDMFRMLLEQLGVCQVPNIN